MSDTQKASERETKLPVTARAISKPSWESPASYFHFISGVYFASGRKSL